MNGPRIGELFSGYGGLGMGVQSVLGGTVAWHSDIDPGACKILAHRYPGIPNLGDITAIDWAQVEPVDVITGGSPCQDVSAAGKRAGMRAGTRSGLWASMCDAVEIIRPGLVVWENVRGVLSAAADSTVESCPVCVGDERESHLRALGRVVGDLSELGYVGRWVGVRASDVGAPHGRFRVFVAAWPAADAAYDGRQRARASRYGWGGFADHSRRTVPDTACDGRHEGWPEPARFLRGSNAAQRGHAAADAVCSGRDGRAPEPVGFEVVGTATSRGGEGASNWGPYAPAVDRWERVLGRVAPPPTQPGAKGQPRLSAAFVEFLMGLPAGWVTDVPGITRNEALKALGNGVVPQQATHALRLMLADQLAAAA